MGARGNDLAHTGPEPIERFDGGADGPNAGLWMAHEAISESCEVRVDGGSAEVRQRGQQTAGVIVVTVTQHHVVYSGQVDAQLVGVVGQSHPLAGVEQNAPTVPLNPERQTVLGQQPSLAGCVLHDNGNR